MFRSAVRAGLVAALSLSVLSPISSAHAAALPDWTTLDTCAGALSPGSAEAGYVTADSKIYSTAMATLVLNIYLHYLPAYQR